MLRRVLLVTIIILFMYSIYLALVFGIVPPYVTYSYEITIRLTNVGCNNYHLNTTSLYPLFILAPTIKGWQSLRAYYVYLNCKLINSIFKITYDKDGNKYLVNTKPIIIKPGETITLKLVQIIDVNWAPFKLNLFRKKATPLTGVNLNEDLSKYSFISPTGLWNYKNNTSKWLALKIFTSNIEKSSRNKLEEVLKCVNWMRNNVKPSLPRAGVQSPTVTFQTRIGTCADQATLIVAMLRLMKIPSFVYLAFIYDPHAVEKSPPQSIMKVAIYNIHRHVFAMASLDNKQWFPIDMTIHTYDMPIENAFVNTSDRIIIWAQAVISDVNKFLIIKSPAMNIRMSVTMRLKFLDDPILKFIKILF